jgi:hypothetical protein
LIPLSCLVSLATTAAALVKTTVVSGPGAGIAFVLATLVIELCVAAFTWLFMNVLWPVVPWFITDLFFYFAVYVAPVLKVLNEAKGLVGKSKRD